MPNSRLIQGDCLEVMQRMIDAGERVHSVVVDPPYHLTSVVKRFGKDGSAPAQHGRDGLYARQSRGFMGKTWDGGDIAFQPETWRLCWELLPPGGHLLAFGSTRTFHRIAVAIEDAGFEVRDTIAWVYGTGFPKSHDLSKGIDKALGQKGTFGAPKSAAHAGWIDRGRMRGEENEEGWQRPWMEDPEQVSNAARKYEPGSPQAREWVGWGTALKPALEPIIVARKPLEGTVAKNALLHRTGGLNIDGCRVLDGSESFNERPKYEPNYRNSVFGRGMGGGEWENTKGRWPANLVHDGSDEVLAAFPESKDGVAIQRNGGGQKIGGNGIYGGSRGLTRKDVGFGGGGSAARFFYSSKASRTDRNEGCESLPDKEWKDEGAAIPERANHPFLPSKNNHPTVKPTSLMRWLCRMVTPPGGTVLDPFMGSGSTGKAASLEGFQFVGIEQDASYMEIARARIAYVGGEVETAEIATAVRNFAEAVSWLRSVLDA